MRRGRLWWRARRINWAFNYAVSCKRPTERRCDVYARLLARPDSHFGFLWRWGRPVTLLGEIAKAETAASRTFAWCKNFHHQSSFAFQSVHSFILGHMHALRKLLYVKISLASVIGISVMYKYTVADGEKKIIFYILKISLLDIFVGNPKIH